jgi:hypothetical protein
LNADRHTNYLEWIPYEKFTDIKKIGEGGFGIVHSATWAEGPKWRWDNERMQWVGSGPRKIAFKALKHSADNQFVKFLKEVRTKSFFLLKKSLIIYVIFYYASLSVILIALV